MKQLTLSDKLKGMGKEFFLQTSTNPDTGMGTCILFESGNPIDIIKFKLSSNNDKATAIVERYHNVHYQRLQRLSQFYEQMADETDASVLEMLAVSLLDQKLYKEALEILNKAVSLDARNSRLYNYLGFTCMVLEDYQKAHEYLVKAVEMAPDFPDYHNNLGMVFLKQGKCYQASKSFEKAIDLNIYYGEAYYNLALAVILNGIKKDDYDLAENLEENATKLLGKSVGFNPILNNEYLQQGLNALRKKDLDNAFKVLSKGYHKVVGGRFLKSNYYFHLEYLFNNGLLSKEVVISHIKKLHKLLETNPNYPDLYNDLGTTYTVLAQLYSQHAVEAYQKALKINPEYKTAMKNLKLTQNELKGLKTLLKAILK